MSTKTNVAPLKIKALAVDENVKDGNITSSPGFIFAKIELISKASVPDVVNKTFLFILFYAPIYIPNEEFLVDITSAYLKNGYDDAYLTEEEIMLMETVRHGVDVNT